MAHSSEGTPKKKKKDEGYSPLECQPALYRKLDPGGVRKGKKQFK